MQKKLFGTLVAGAVAGLVYASAAMADGSGAKTTAKKPKGVKCENATACAGKGECKTATNECKGKNGCGGQGWMMMKNEKDCKKAQEANKKKEG